MRIPEVREELLRLADEIDDPMRGKGTRDYLDWASRLHTLVQELYRRPYVRKARAKRSCPSPEEIRAYAAAHPEADYVTIAAHFGTNPGRVSEALAGFRS